MSSELHTDAERVERLAKWAKTNQRKLTFGLGAVAVVVAGFIFSSSARSRRENFAQRELTQARAAADAGNAALAANDLSRLTNSYAGTRSAEEATLLLAELRLAQGQAALAVADLQAYVGRGPRDQFRAPAYQLLGVALEQLGQFRDAGQAYLAGASGTGMDLVRSDLLIDAGRALALAGDTVGAISAFERVIADFEDSPGAIEAQLRLGQLRQTDMN